MGDTVKDEDKKKKKGMVVVIAVGGKPPKAPTKTMDADDKKKTFEKAWKILKEDPPPGTYDSQGVQYDTQCPSCGKGIYREDEGDLMFIRETGKCTDCIRRIPRQ